ncbi:hypothetical protein JOM56_004609 [Amanita muscaria]
MSASTVKRRRKDLELRGSAATTKTIDPAEAEQLVLKALDKDPAKCSGMRTIHQKIAFDDNIHLTQDFVSKVMHTHDGDAFAGREPTAKRIFRVKKYPIGIHEHWAADGHDKLYKIGFPIWAIVDDATGKWLGAWVVPSNRTGNIIAYLWLCTVEKYGGIPIQFTTDCGSETTVVNGYVHAFRLIFHGDIKITDVPAYNYLRSIHNISAERSWLRLHLDFGDNAVLFFNKGIEEGVYNSDDANHYQLCQWLWPRLLQKELDKFMEFQNGCMMRKDKEKPGSSGMSRNQAFSLPEMWGGRDCLLGLTDKNLSVIQELKAWLGGDKLVSFSKPEFSARAQEAYNSLAIVDLTFENVWGVFTAMLPLSPLSGVSADDEFGQSGCVKL